MTAFEHRVRSRIERLVDLREGELPALRLAFAYFFFLLCGYYILRPVRDTMGIAGGVEHLQWLFTATFVTMLCVVPVFGWLVRRYPRRRFVPVAYRFFALNLLIFFAVFQIPEIEVHAARVFFVWLSVFNLFVVSVFWSFMADIFTEAQGKRLFGAIAAGGTSGAMLGPILTTALAVPIGPVNLMLISALFIEGAVFCARRLSGHRFQGASADRDREPIGGGIFAGATTVARSPYLMMIGLYLLFLTWTATFVYFQQAEIVVRAFADAGERTRFFALIDLTVNLVTFGLQLFVTGRLITRFGVISGLMLLPALTALGFAGLASSPVLLMLVAVQSLRRAANYAIAGPVREVLFTVVPREQKYKSKNFLDTVVYRAGDAASGWLYAGLAGLGLGSSVIALTGVPIALAWLGTARYLGNRHEAVARKSP